MDIIKIVFTGGPCAGKTTLINKTREYLQKNNYKVLVVPETATNILGIGINSKLLGSVEKFQSVIFKKQIFNEKLIENVSKKLKGEQLIILYDRGILDNKAYCENYQTFDKIINTQSRSEISFLDNYDLVFDLISTAVCAPEKYNLTSNKERTETIEEAIQLDQQTSNAWVGHSNLKIINSNISLEDVFKIIKKEILDYIKNSNKQEIKQFYLDNLIDDFINYNDKNSRLIDIEEIHLNKNKSNINYVIYKRIYKDSTSYVLKVFKKENNIIKTYYNTKILFEEYLELLTKYGIKDSIAYKQLSFIENRQNYDIKFFDDCTILEYEENKLNEELIFPNNIKIKSNKMLLKRKKNDNIS